MTGPGRPVGPEGRLERSQVMLDQDTREMLARSSRTGSSMLRHAIRIQYALDQIAVRPAFLESLDPSRQLFIIRDLHFKAWRVLSPSVHFTVQATLDPQDARGPVLGVDDTGHARPAVIYPDRESLDRSHLYVITDILQEPDMQFGFGEMYRVAVTRIHADPEAMFHEPA